MRYFSKQSVCIGNTYQSNAGSISGSTYVGFKVTMRASPTITFVNISQALTNSDGANFITANGFSFAFNITATGTYSRNSLASISIEL